MAEHAPITLALFWSKVAIPDETTNCWEWTRTLSESGYGRFRRHGKWYLAHRFSYEQMKGPIPEGMVVRHMCHNRLCCNPLHLKIGTAKDNAQDALDAGRFAQGTVNGNAKLKPADIVHIRRNPENLKARDLAK